MLAIGGVLTAACLIGAALLFGQRFGGSFSLPVAGGLTRHEVIDAVNRQAVCNDGSPAIYYFRPATDASASTKWIVFLQGGGSCSSVDGCEERRVSDRELTTSVGEPETRVVDGIFSPDAVNNPDFYDWNQVVLHYCSSDGWVGDDEVSGTSMNWQFHGYNIVGAVIDDLKNETETSTNLSQATEVIFGGSSAGAAGAEQNLDRVASLLPNAKVSGILDSIWKFAVEPFGPPTVLYEADTNLYLDDVNPFRDVHLDDTCMAAHPDGAACAVTETLAPYLSTPFFVYRDQRDPVLFRLVGLESLSSPGQKTYYQNTYRPRLLDSLSTLDGVFSPDIQMHTALAIPRFYDVRVDGVSFADAFGNWYFHRSGPTSVIAK